MGNLDCCHKTIDEQVIETQTTFYEKYPHDSDPSLRAKIKKEIIEQKKEIEIRKEKISEKWQIDANAYEVEIKDNIQNNDDEENNDNNEIENQEEEEQNNKDELNDNHENDQTSDNQEKKLEKENQEKEGNNNQENHNKVEKKENEENKGEKENQEKEMDKENQENEELVINIPISDNNNGLRQIKKDTNTINDHEKIDLNNYGLDEKEIENLNLKDAELENNENNFNQFNKNGKFNNYYEQNIIQQNTENIEFNQYDFYNDNNNQFELNNLGLTNSNMSHATEEPNNLNNINIYSSAFTFGEPQQLKESLTVSYTNREESYPYNLSLYTFDSTTKLY